MLELINKIRNSKFRVVVWPIRSYEFYKFFPMAMMMFMILLNQNIVRIMKDSIVITLVGAEVISFVKLWGEMPAGILFVVIYSKLCNVVTTEKAFRMIVLFFLSFFLFFGFVLFPNAEYFHPDPVFVQTCIESMPHAKWFMIIWSKWTFILFYIMGELWPIIVFSLLFWQLANKITKTEEASRFYSFFSLFGQTNLLISGSVIFYFKTTSHFLMFMFDSAGDKTEVMVKSLITLVGITGIVILCLHYFIEKKVMTDKKLYKSSEGKVLKLGIVESFKMILTSRYLGLITVLMICYGMSVNLIEGVWMNKVKEQYSSPEGFMAYQGKVLFWTGVFTLICSFLGSYIIRQLGWYAGAIITPFMIMLAGTIFFCFVAAEDYLSDIFWGITYLSPLAIITFIGGLQNVLGKGTKYSLFDATKEMAYIPLDNEMKTKGKAAADVIGNKIGKSTGAIIQFLIFTIMPGARYDDISIFLGGVFILVCLAWIYSVKLLSNEYETLTKKP
jgi:ATP:ADP antiporter, AAA family